MRSMREDGFRRFAAQFLQTVCLYYGGRLVKMLYLDYNSRSGYFSSGRTSQIGLDELYNDEVRDSGFLCEEIIRESLMRKEDILSLIAEFLGCN